MNFDATFKDGLTVTGVVLRNNFSYILGAWTNRFRLDNPFCVEVEATIQTLKIDDGLNLDKVTFEGDAFNDIMALQGFSQIEDWRDIKLITAGKKMLLPRCFWFLNHVLRSCNSHAHNLARWACNSGLCGFMNLSHLPSDLWTGGEVT